MGIRNSLGGLESLSELMENLACYHGVTELARVNRIVRGVTEEILAGDFGDELGYIDEIRTKACRHMSHF